MLATSAAYRDGSTASTVSACPPGADQDVCQTVADRRTPGTAVIAFCAAGVTGRLTMPGPAAVPVLTTTSAPVTCQEAAASPRATASRTMPANAATLSPRTSANTGKTPVSEVRDARASATKPVAPAARADSRSSPLMASG